MTHPAHPADHFQLFPALDPATESALRASIQRWGVIHPVVVDQHGRIIDGYHRSRIADSLGIDYKTITVDVDDDDHARELARTLNMDRRHLDPEQRRQMVAALRSEGHSYRAIGNALGVSQMTAQRDAATVTGVTVDRVVGIDGKSRPATRPKPDPVPREVAPVEVAARLDPTDGEWEDDEAEQIVDTLERDHGQSIPPAAVDQAVAERNDSLRTPTSSTGREITPVAKKVVAEGIPPHPATYPRAVLDIFREAIPAGSTVLDPFGGVGGIHELRPEVETWAVEIEAEWAKASPYTIHGDSTRLDDLLADGLHQAFDVVATSPAYGNRLADDYRASDPEGRHSYAIDLGRSLTDGNGAGLHFATDGRYEDLHAEVWAQAVRALRPGGLFLLNCKDFRRAGKIMRPTGWHLERLTGLGLRVVDLWTIPVAGLGHVTAAKLSELVVALRKA